MKMKITWFDVPLRLGIVFSVIWAKHQVPAEQQALASLIVFAACFIVVYCAPKVEL